MAEVNTIFVCPCVGLCRCHDNPIFKLLDQGVVTLLGERVEGAMHQGLSDGQLVGAQDVGQVGEAVSNDSGGFQEGFTESGNEFDTELRIAQL